MVNDCYEIVMGDIYIYPLSKSSLIYNVGGAAHSQPPSAAKKAGRPSTYCTDWPEHSIFTSAKRYQSYPRSEERNER